MGEKTFMAHHTVGALIAALSALPTHARVYGTEVTGIIVVPQEDGAILVGNERRAPIARAVAA